MINLPRFFYLRTKGLNMVEIADDLKCRRETIQAWCNRFRDMSDEEFKKWVNK